jgi:glycyl-tRNA synthetase
MASKVDAQAILQQLRDAVKEQGDVVRKLKENGRPKIEITEAVSELKARKKRLEEKEKALAPPEEKFNRAGLEDLVKRRFFYSVSYSIYGGFAGLYDYGPMGCAMKTNLINIWRQHFVIQDNLLEIDTPTLAPSVVLKSSGHVDKFADVMVKDLKTGQCYRADHLIQDFFEAELAKPKCPQEKKEEYEKIITTLDNLTKDEIGDVLTKYGIKAPITNNDLSEPLDFNLMFSTSIGPGGHIPSFLRPETAQGIFVNFKKLLEFNNGHLPFGAATIGRAFRNEISPRSGLIRVREFDLAEMEYFVNPEKKKERFAKFQSVADVTPYLWDRDKQLTGAGPIKMSLGEAVSSGIIANEFLGYFVGRIYLYLVRVGIDPEKLRFRQHMFNEMAHYATDCWDAECKTSYGWVECVGCADRACFDLSCHQKTTGVELVAQEPLPEPRKVDVVEVVPDRKVLGKQFKKDSQLIAEYLKGLSECDIGELEKSLKEKGSYTIELPQGPQFTLEPNMVTVRRTEKMVHVHEFQPGVIEPSFGIGRILYAILEHSYRVRPEDEQRKWLSLPPEVAPIACSVVPLSNNPEFTPYIEQLSQALTRLAVSHKVDDSSGSIGRRYARTDEVAIPFGMTVDFDTLKSNTATLRERNTTKQIRAKLDVLPGLVASLVRGVQTWEQVRKEYPEFTGQESTK